MEYTIAENGSPRPRDTRVYHCDIRPSACYKYSRATAEPQIKDFNKTLIRSVDIACLPISVLKLYKISSNILYDTNDTKVMFFYFIDQQDSFLLLLWIETDSMYVRVLWKVTSFSKLSRAVAYMI